MKAKSIKIINLIVAVLIALFAIGQAFAWFLDGKMSLWQGFGGSSAGAYFAYGTGTEADPFGIDNKYHMYNLAWLQNTGRLDDEYYFELSEELTDPLDMDDMWLPPIGNDAHPFTGKFNGNGKEISGLKITTDKDLLKEEYAIPVNDDYEFSNAVGTFGMTTKDSEIANVILKNPVVQAATVNSADNKPVNYATEWDGTDADTHSKRVIGLAVGHVAGKCYSIGVRATAEGQTRLDLKKIGYSTFNSILGELGAGVESSVTGGGHAMGSGGSGNAFGASFDVAGMYDRLVNVEANKKSTTPAWRLPDLGDSSSDGITLATHEKLPFTVASESTYEGADAAEVIGGSNIGYMVGNQNKVYNKKVTFGDKLTAPGGTNGTNWHFPDGSIPADDKTIPRWIYKISAQDVASDTYNDYTGFSPLSDAEYKSLSDDILELIPKNNGDVEGFNSVRLSQTYNNAGVQIYPGSTSNGQWSPHGQISWMGKTYGEGYTMTDYMGPAVDENGVRYTSEGYKIDDKGYMYSEDGYFTSSEWPLPNAVDEEGYLLDGSDRFVDADGEPVKYGGYDLGYDGSAYYLIKKDGTPLEWDKGWGRQRVEPRKGNTVEFYRFTGGIALPNCGIWFKPSQAGTIRFVMYAEKAGNGFTLIKGTRTNATKDNPFYVDYSVNGKDVKTEEVFKYTMPSWVLFYYEYEVKQEDIDAGNVEYWLMQYGNGGAYFVYMDLGASAAEDENGIDRDKAVSAIDFIYGGVEISKEDEEGTSPKYKIGDFIVSTGGASEKYEASQTSVYFEKLNVALEIVFVRLHGQSDGKTIEVAVTPASAEVTATNTTLVAGLTTG